MSLDARYILNYDILEYLPPTPQKKDKEFLLKAIPSLKDKDFVEFDYGFSIFFSMPKYTLLPEQISKLLADRVLERLDGELWQIIK